MYKSSEFLFFLEKGSFRARIEHLDQMIAWVDKSMQKTAIHKRDRLKIELAMEEALVNIIHHAYPHIAMAGEIEIAIELRFSEKINIQITDWGLPFNPLLQPQKSVHYPLLEEWEEGGLGIFFMQRCMDEVYYERRHPFNILTLIKKLC